METIYTGNEPMLTDYLIEKTIKDKQINPLEIQYIRIFCNLPDDKYHLWTITIHIEANYKYDGIYYSKKCIQHHYGMTYLTHLKRMGAKKFDFKKMRWK